VRKIYPDSDDLFHGYSLWTVREKKDDYEKY
jgi:hypothetical protein